MEIRKGPYGHYAIDKLGSIDDISEYSREIISENILNHLLPVYINPSVQGYELYFDYSGLTPLKNNKPDNIEEINNLRTSLGDLLLTFSLMPDYLLSPSKLNLDEAFIFTSNDYTDLKVCFNPCKTNPETLNIASLTSAEIRKLLESDTLAYVIKPDETDTIIYALQSNDEDLFIKGANKIKQPITEDTKKISLLSSYDFLRCLIASLFSLGFTIIGLSVPALILVFISVALAVKTYLYWDINSKQKPMIKPEDDSKKEMLFSSKNFNDVLTCLVLTTTDNNGGKISKSIYTDKATIGSDRFLCDLFIDEDKVSPIHAEIKKRNKSYYIRDMSSDNSTFLDNVRLEAQREYEIKSGQTLICGRLEFQIEIV